MQGRRTEDFLAELARAYYEQALTQEQVATQFGISRSQVSRYLQQARDLEIVQVRIVAPESRDRDAEAKDLDRFPHLREVVTAAFSTSPMTLRRAVARTAARLVERFVNPGSTVCFGAGRTLAELVDLLARRPLGNVAVVQAMGNAGHEGLKIDYNAIAQHAAAAFDGRAYQINARELGCPWSSVRHYASLAFAPKREAVQDTAGRGRLRSLVSDPMHLQDLVAVVVDHLDGDPAARRAREGA